MDRPTVGQTVDPPKGRGCDRWTGRGEVVVLRDIVQSVESGGMSSGLAEGPEQLSVRGFRADGAVRGRGCSRAPVTLEVETVGKNDGEAVVERHVDPRVRTAGQTRQKHYYDHRLTWKS